MGCERLLHTPEGPGAGCELLVMVADGASVRRRFLSGSSLSCCICKHTMHHNIMNISPLVFCRHLQSTFPLYLKKKKNSDIIYIK